MRSFILPVLCTFALSAQSPIVQIDEFEGVTKTISHPYQIKVDQSSFFNSRNLFFEAWKYEFKDQKKETVYQIRSVLTQDGWLFIDSGESLVVLVDGERIGLTSEEGSVRFRKVISGSIIQEIAFHRIDVLTLKKICAAKEVKIKLSGQSSYITGSATEKGQKAFLGFAEKALP